MTSTTYLWAVGGSAARAHTIPLANLGSGITALCGAKARQPWARNERAGYCPRCAAQVETRGIQVQ